MLAGMTVTAKEKETYAKVHYQHALQLCFARAAGTERAAIAAVMDNARYKITDAFQCIIREPTPRQRQLMPEKKTGYTFAAPTRVMDYPGVIDLIAAHEICHALQHAAGEMSQRTNLHHRKNALLNLAEKLPNMRQRMRQTSYKFRHRAKDAPVRRFMKGAVYWALHGFATLLCPVRAAANYLSRIEEKSCDAYGFMHFPDTDLAAFRKMLYTERPGIVDDLDRTVARNARLSDFSLWLGDVFTAASHPHPERRYRHLLQARQRKTAAAPAAAPAIVS